MPPRQPGQPGSSRSQGAGGLALAVKNMAKGMVDPNKPKRIRIRKRDVSEALLRRAAQPV